MEFPTRERVLAGESFYYDAGGEGRALCCRCFCPIDMEFGEYAEVAVMRKGMERGVRITRLGA